VNTPGREVSNAATTQWYEYSWTSHLLSPNPMFSPSGPPTAGMRFSRF